MKIPRPAKLVITATLILAGSYLLGHTTIKRPRPITLEELRYGMPPEQAAQLTEKDLVIDGKPIHILTVTHYYSILWMLIGGCLGGAIAFGGITLIEKKKEKFQQAA